MAWVETASAQSAVLDSLQPQPLDEAMEALAAELSVSVDFGEIDLNEYRSEWVLRPTTSLTAFQQAIGSAPIAVVEISPRFFRLVEQTPDASLPATTPPPTDTIIVTATKREADPRDLPIGITVLGKESLRQSGFVSSSDLSGPIAAFSTTSQGPGRDKFFIRGLADGSFADRSQSTVGIYYGDTPLAFNETAPAIRFFDFDRIEVLKGPQSTLFGASNIGGAIRFIPTAPDLDSIEQEYRLEGRTTKNGSPGYSADAVLNLPLISGKMGLRISAYRNESGGYINNITQGLDDINLTLEEGIRSTLRYQPTTSSAIDLAHLRTEIKSSDTQYATRGLSRSIEFREPYDDIFDLWSLRLAHDVGNLSFTSITSYTDRSTDSVADASFLLAIENEFESFSEQIRALTFQKRDITALVHESRARSSIGPISWLSGIHVLNREERNRSSVFEFEFGDDVFLSGFDQETTELALFGEATWSVRADLDITFGLRAQYTDIDAVATAGGIFNDGVERLETSRSENQVSPRFAAIWEATPALNVYAQATRGTRIGGLNFNTPVAVFIPGNTEVITDQGRLFSLVNPEIFGDTALPTDQSLALDPTQFSSDRVWNSELGLKYQSLNNRLGINAAVFHLDWTDIQSDQILPSGQTFVVNAGDARVTGVDIETSVVFPGDIEFQSSFVYNNSRLVDPINFLAGTEGASLPSVPDVIAGASLTIPLSARHHHKPFLSIQFRHIGPSDILFADDTPTSDGFTEVNARLTYAAESWQLDFFIDNLLDAQGDRFAFGNNSSFLTDDQSTPLRPMTAGIAISRGF